MIIWNEKHKKVASIAADHQKVQLVCCGISNRRPNRHGSDLRLQILLHY